MKDDCMKNRAGNQDRLREERERQRERKREREESTGQTVWWQKE
jgi:hypothetical protein